jgi:major type 1 subunit fimbrin (pilin)
MGARATSAMGAQPVALVNGAATLNYFAQHYTVGGAATSGRVSATISYSIVYQ